MRKEELVWRWDELESNIEKKFAKIEEHVELLRDRLSVSERLSASEKFAERKEEIRELRQRFAVRKERQELRQFVDSMLKRNMILGNPSMTSGKFADSLEELKRFVQDYRNKKDDEEK